jgi:hypothetical protein
MHVELNETNIDKYNLVELTGNSREHMLNEAANAAAKGHILSVNVPDELVLEQNVFDVYESEHVDPRRLNHCGYEEREDEDGNKYMVCVLHNKTSRHDISKEPEAPCLQVDPEVKPSDEEFADALSKVDKTCAYNKIDDPETGTRYICAVHGRPSKYDISRLPNMSCLTVDPKVAGELTANNDISEY